MAAVAGSLGIPLFKVRELLIEAEEPIPREFGEVTGAPYQRRAQGQIASWIRAHPKERLPTDRWLVAKKVGCTLGTVDSYLCRRRKKAANLPKDLPDAHRWKNLKAIGIAINNTVRDGKMCIAVRYYILSRYVSGSRFADAVRSHWGVENNLHWQLDVTFSEDQSRIRKGHADANFSILRRTALSLLKNELTAKVGIKNKRLNAGWDDTYLAKVLFGK